MHFGFMNVMYIMTTDMFRSTMWPPLGWREQEHIYL